MDSITHHITLAKRCNKNKCKGSQTGNIAALLFPPQVVAGGTADKSSMLIKLKENCLAKF